MKLHCKYVILALVCGVLGLAYVPYTDADAVPLLSRVSGFDPEMEQMQLTDTAESDREDLMDTKGSLLANAQQTRIAPEQRTPVTANPSRSLSEDRPGFYTRRFPDRNYYSSKLFSSSRRLLLLQRLTI